MDKSQYLKTKATNTLEGPKPLDEHADLDEKHLFEHRRAKDLKLQKADKNSGKTNLDTKLKSPTPSKEKSKPANKHEHKEPKPAHKPENKESKTAQKPENKESKTAQKPENKESKTAHKPEKKESKTKSKSPTPSKKESKPAHKPEKKKSETKSKSPTPAPKESKPNLKPEKKKSETKQKSPTPSKKETKPVESKKPDVKDIPSKKSILKKGGSKAKQRPDNPTPEEKGKAGDKPPTPPKTDSKPAPDSKNNNNSNAAAPAPKPSQPETKPSSLKPPDKDKDTASKAPTVQKEKPKCSCKCCACCQRCWKSFTSLRAGMCRCWYCLLCFLPLFWLWGCLAVACGLTCGLYYVLWDYPSHWEIHVIIWGTLGMAVLFLILVQLSYFLVMYESVRKSGIILFSVLFVITFLIIALVITIATQCDLYCSGKEYNKASAYYYPAIMIRYCRMAVCVTFVFLVFTMHIYCYYVQKFKGEKAEFDCCEESTSAPAKDAKESKANVPEVQSSQNNNNSNAPSASTQFSDTTTQTRDCCAQPQVYDVEQGPTEYQRAKPKNVKLFYVRM